MDQQQLARLRARLEAASLEQYGPMVRWIRVDQLGWTVAKLADVAGVSESMIEKYERNARVLGRARSRHRLTAALTGRTPDEQPVFSRERFLRIAAVGSAQFLFGRTAPSQQRRLLYLWDLDYRLDRALVDVLDFTQSAVEAPRGVASEALGSPLYTWFPDDRRLFSLLAKCHLVIRLSYEETGILPADGVAQAADHLAAAEEYAFLAEDPILEALVLWDKGVHARIHGDYQDGTKRHRRAEAIFGYLAVSDSPIARAFGHLELARISISQAKEAKHFDGLLAKAKEESSRIDEGLPQLRERCRLGEFVARYAQQHILETELRGAARLRSARASADSVEDFKHMVRAFTDDPPPGTTKHLQISALYCLARIYFRAGRMQDSLRLILQTMQGANAEGLDHQRWVGGQVLDDLGIARGKITRCEDVYCGTHGGRAMFKFKEDSSGRSFVCSECCSKLRI